MTKIAHFPAAAEIAVSNLKLKSLDMTWLNLLADAMIKDSELAAEFLATQLTAKLALKDTL